MSGEGAIKPDRLYTFKEAASLIPSPHGGGGIRYATLYHWWQNGRVHCVERRVGKTVFRFVLGSEVMRLIADGCTAAAR